MVDVAVAVSAKESNACSVLGCVRCATRKGVCDTHYRRLKRYGAAGDGYIPERKRLPELCSIEGCDRKAHSFLGGDAVCKRHYSSLRRLDSSKGQTVDPAKEVFEVCTVEGCDHPPAWRHSPYCVSHYHKNRRYGDPLWERSIQQRGFNEDGYEWIFVGAHYPLSGGRSRILYHRYVLFEALGSGPCPCRWCGKTLTWGGRAHNSVIVDHLDGDKSHNELENLVPSCQRCNIGRAAFVDWVKRHFDDPLLLGALPIVEGLGWSGQPSS
jgi:hypothetical protein